MTEIVVRVPVPRTSRTASRVLAQRRPLPDAPRLLLISNGKPRAADVLSAVGEALVRRGRISEYEVAKKAMASRPMTDGEARRFAAQAHLFVTGVGS